jgi:hypothetical protein
MLHYCLGVTNLLFDSLDDPNRTSQTRRRRSRALKSVNEIGNELSCTDPLESVKSLVSVMKDNADIALIPELEELVAELKERLDKQDFDEEQLSAAMRAIVSEQWIKEKLLPLLEPVALYSLQVKTIALLNHLDNLIALPEFIGIANLDDKNHVVVKRAGEEVKVLCKRRKFKSQFRWGFKAEVICQACKWGRSKRQKKKIIRENFDSRISVCGDGKIPPLVDEGHSGHEQFLVQIKEARSIAEIDYQIEDAAYHQVSLILTKMSFGSDSLFETRSSESIKVVLKDACSDHPGRGSLATLEVMLQLDTVKHPL